MHAHNPITFEAPRHRISGYLQGHMNTKSDPEVVILLAGAEVDGGDIRRLHRLMRLGGDSPDTVRLFRSSIALLFPYPDQAMPSAFPQFRSFASKLHTEMPHWAYFLSTNHPALWYLTLALVPGIEVVQWEKRVLPKVRIRNVATQNRIGEIHEAAMQAGKNLGESEAALKEFSRKLLHYYSVWLSRCGRV